MRVVIAGGGIVGACCAEFLSASGAQVVVVESGSLGGGATAAGMGHIVVMDDSEAQMQLTRYSRKTWIAWQQQLPASSQMNQTGTIWVATDDEEMQEANRKYDYYMNHDVYCEQLDRKRIHELEPLLGDRAIGGLLVPNDWVMYPTPVCQFFIERAIERGGQLIQGNKIVEFDESKIVLEDGQSIEGDTFINALGCDSVQFFSDVPVQPRKGHLVITDRFPGQVNRQLIELGYLKSAHSAGSESVAFNAQPRSTGQLLIGSSRQFGVDDTIIDRAILSKMLQRCLYYMPCLTDASIVRTWTGFRAAMPDHLPAIGSTKQAPNLIHATGHEGLGISTAMGTAHLIDCQLFNKEPEFDPTPYSPNRFQQTREMEESE